MQKVDYKKIALVSVWASFTLALLAWWVVFAFRQLNALKSLGVDLGDKILSHQKMLIYEGITLFLCLGFGALFLLYFVYIENSRLKERRDFFSAFTHDLKTSIAVLRLKLEKISTISNDIEEVKMIGTRLSIQLQNALQVSYFDSQELLLEQISILNEMDFIRGLWPDLSLSFKGDYKVMADKIAIRSIINNIIQNAIEHSKAETLFVHQNIEDGFIKVSFSSDGKSSTKIDKSELETGVFRRRSNEGSGLGLKISKSLIKKMGGKIKYTLDDEKRLVVHTYLKASKDQA